MLLPGDPAAPEVTQHEEHDEDDADNKDDRFEAHGRHHLLLSPLYGRERNAGSSSGRSGHATP